MANSLDVELKPIGLSDAGEIERAVSAFAGSPNGGLIVVVSGASLIHRELIVTLAARHQLPVVYPYRVFVTGGGLTKVDTGHDSSASTDQPPPPCSWLAALAGPTRPRLVAWP